MTDSTIAIIVLTLLIGLVLILVLSNVSSKSKGKSILLLGEIDAGKTVLYHQLKENRLVQTVTSMAVNEGQFVPKGLDRVPEAQQWTYVDIPGHGSFRLIQQKLIPETRAIVFLVDACNELQWMSVGQRLYTLLSDSHLVGNDVPLIIALNKSDKPTALSQSKVKAALETTLEKIRKANTGVKQLDNLGGGSEGTTTVPIVKKEDTPFTFANSSLDTTFVSISAKNGEVKQLVDELANVSKK